MSDQDLKKIRTAECPVCHNPDAKVTHGFLDARLRNVHLWDCPECGESEVVIERCPICATIIRAAMMEKETAALPMVVFTGNREIEAVCPIDPDKIAAKPWSETILADANRQWLLVCDGFSLVVHPLDEFNRLDKTGHMYAGDVARIRARNGTAAFKMSVRPGRQGFPDVDQVIEDRIVKTEYVPIAVLDGDRLHDIVAATCGGKQQRLVMLYADKAALKAYAEGTETDDQKDGPQNFGLLIVPAFKGDPDVPRAWGFLMNCGGGTSPKDILQEVIKDTGERLAGMDIPVGPDADAAAHEDIDMILIGPDGGS